MAVEFRCEKCGKLLSVDAESAEKVKCPFCKAKVLVPAGLASLPTPQIPPREPAPAGPPAVPVMAVTAGTPAAEQPLYEPSDALMQVMAKLMPWVISLFFHAGMVVILTFVTIVVMKTTPKDVTVPELEMDIPGANSSLRPGYGSVPELAPRSLDAAGKTGGWARYQSSVAVAGADLGPNPGGNGDTGTVSVIGVAGTGGISGVGTGGGGAAAPFGLTGGGGEGGGRRVTFYKVPSKGAYHVVYVVDCSGSMLDTFDDVRKELLNSISRLDDKQTFHVIFFSVGPPKENPPRRLVKADTEAKREAARFLRDIQPQRQTDPVPALKRAFEVLAQAPTKTGKVIFLLTDGEFPDNEAVLKAIKAMNADGSVQINTILHRFKVEAAMKVLQQIADENGGTFKFVEVTE